MFDLISRRALCDFALNQHDKTITPNDIMRFPSAQPEQLTDDDFETIRIHLSAIKEDLCNQGRWKEAEEYECIIDRFMAFASAQLEIIRCKDCKWCEERYDTDGNVPYWICKNWDSGTDADGFCYEAERRE